MAKRFSGLWLSVVLLVAVLGLASSADPPVSFPPSPAPESDLKSPDSAPSMPPSVADAPNSSPPSPPPETESPPPQAPGSSPTPDSPPSDEASPASTPTPSDLSDVTHTGDMDGDEDNADESSGGMSSAKKAGIAFGVIAAVSLVVLGGIVYKKRQNNIRRSEYGYAARREIL